MESTVKCLLIGLLVSFFSCAAVWAQATAQITGTVKDQSGAVLPGVEISATQTDTGLARNAVTNETGSFVLPNLPTGPYRLEAALPGFRTYVQTGIVLQVNSNPAINVVLEVGQVTEQVEVQANAALVETRSVGVGQVVENERILELPLNGRQVTDLIVLAGAAVQTGAANKRSIPGIPAISVASGLSTGVVYILDGAMHNNPYDNLTLPLPFPDALQEFKVETSALSAQYGMYSGASVSAVTKSGTNQLHGNLFEFVRNDLFNARNYFATKSSTLKRNQFGGTAGGPIMQNKLFFFGAFQRTTVRQDPADIRTFVPTAAMLAGDFTAVTAPQCRANGQQLNLRAPFVNNRIDPALLSKAAVNIAGKLPKTTDSCGLITYGLRTVTNENQFVGKIDYQWSDKHSLFGRYVATAPKQPPPYSFDLNALNSTNPGSDNLAQSYAVADTYLVGPNTINSYRFVVNRAAIHRTNGDFFSGPEVGVNLYTYTPKFITLSVTGGFALGGSSAADATQRTTTYQTSDDLSLVRGAHQMSFGASGAHWRINFNAKGFSAGDFQFNSQETGLGLADFLAGKPSQLTQVAPNTVYMSQWYLGLYGADTWKVTPRLTLNYGLRWEPFFPQLVRNGVIDSFDEERFKARIKSTVFSNAPFGFYYPGDPGFPGECPAEKGCRGSGMYNQWGNITPRLGLAWDVRGDGRLSVRTSYGMAYDMLVGQFYTTFISNPWSNSVIVASPPGGFDNPWQGYPGGNPFPVTKLGANSVFVPFGNYWTVKYDNPSTTRHSWNLSIQKQISADWLVSTSYMGSQAVHLWTDREINPAIYIPGGPCTLQGVTYNPCSTAGNRNVRRRLALQYPDVQTTTMAFLGQLETAGTQSYHGLLVSVQRRAARGVTIAGNYTWSHCLGDTSRMGGTPGATFLDPNNRNFDRGNCDGDRRHIFNMTAVAETPRFANPKVRALATGWRLSGIYKKSSGSWLTILSGQDRELSGVQSQRAQQVLENPYGAKTLTNYLNPAAFTLPALGSLGNMRPGNVEGPGTWQFDVALSRIFGIGESRRLEVRGEAYNVTNSLRPGNPNTTTSSSTFGQITTSSDPRILQFALKYAF